MTLKEAKEITNFLKGYSEKLLTTEQEVIIEFDERIAELEDCLRNLEDAASAFEALPPEDMKGSLSFNQFTTAEDCRDLIKTLAKTREVLEENNP